MDICVDAVALIMQERPNRIKIPFEINYEWH